MAANQNPTSSNNLTQWKLLQTLPRERMVSIVSESVTIYGEAPSGAHVAEPRWIIWKETKDSDGRITREYAQDGINTLYWIYNSIAFDPIPDPSGVPYVISLDNTNVVDGMGAGLPVANIAVSDVDGGPYTLTLVSDVGNKFQIIGSVLSLTATVDIADIAYPIKIKAVDSEGNEFYQVFAIYVVLAAPPTVEFVGELSDFQEATVLQGANDVVFTYTVPAARAVRLSSIDCFGVNQATFVVKVDATTIASKGTPAFIRFETEFDFDDYVVTAGEVITVTIENKGDSDGVFNARLTGYQYSV